MSRASHLRSDSLRIWHAGLEAVRSDRLIPDCVETHGSTLIFSHVPDEPHRVDLHSVKKIAVVGAGKAGAGMAAALEAILRPALLCKEQLIGWVNVPAGTEEQAGIRTERIHLHPARPAGVNEPTAEGVAGSEEILRIVASLGSEDLCVALISGGGSALLPAPIEGITLADKLAVTRFLSAAGANIAELNTVRKQLSRIKGGALARACRACQLIALIISDVPGDPLDLIASGPTVQDTSTPRDAIDILDRFGGREDGSFSAVFEALRERDRTRQRQEPASCRVTNVVIGNNAMAVDAAGQEAERLGYSHALTCAPKPEGALEEIGRHLAEMAVSMRDSNGPNCLISGGEGTVKLIAEADRGLGGRNQQTVLAALARLHEIDGGPANAAPGIVILSAGTDGEDGPTDAAGAFVDTAVIEDATQRGLDPADFLRRNDAYHFFEPLGALIKTGPTNTNVCDLRVVLVDQSAEAERAK